MSQVLMGSRRTGKSTSLVRWMGEAPDGVKRVLVAPNLRQVKYLQALAEERGIEYEPWQFLGCSQAAEALRGRSWNIEIGVDEINYCRPGWDEGLTFPIKFATATIEDY